MYSPSTTYPLMGGALGKKQGQGTAGKRGEGSGLFPLPGTSRSTLSFCKNKRNPLRHRNSLSEFSLNDLASNLTNRFSVLSGLSFISFVSLPATETNKRPWTRISRKKWHPSTLQNEYAQCKTVWPVAQTEALFLPEFPVGTEEKLKLILHGEIGRGAFGQVFHVRCSVSHREYAMKVLSKSQVCSLDAVQQVKQEVMIQHACSHHPFIAPLTHYWQTRKLLIIMTEYIGYGELQQLWRSLGRFPESLLILYVAEIALSLDFLQNAGIIYRDLKMENILLDVDGHIKLIDFGLSRWLSYGGHANTICGTLQFMAPEILKGESYSHSADWWSLGIIAYSLLAGHYPVSGYDDHISMGGAVEKFVYTLPEGSSRAVQSLLMGLLQRCPSSRIHTLHQLQKEELYIHIDFDDIRDKKVSPRMALEKFIEGKSRPNFEDFVGLTSTPKREIPPVEGEGSPATLFSKPSKSPLMGGRAVLWDRAKRSCSSPLLSSPLTHPGRLGHHDALVKSVSSSGYNGAAVPLLQSPLLRLARGQGPVPSRRRSQRAVSASALPTAVSPLLVNVRGSCKGQWLGREKTRENSRYVPGARDTDSSSSPTHSPPRRTDPLLGINDPYSKYASDECIARPQGAGGIRRSKTGIDTQVFTPPWASAKKDVNPFLEHSGATGSPSLRQRRESCMDTDGPVVTSMPKRAGPNLGTPPSYLGCQRLSSKPSTKAVNFGGQVGKCSLANGALIGNNFSPLAEKDFDSTLDHFPWVSESLDL